MATNTSGGTTTSFTNTPQAKDDSYNWTETQLQNSGLLAGNIITLDVMANDLGGNAKTLWSVDDGNGNTLAPEYELLVKDTAAGVWETSANGNSFRITTAGKIEFKLNGITNIDSLTANDHIHDEFVYAIRLGNGTLSQA